MKIKAKMNRKQDYDKLKLLSYLSAEIEQIAYITTKNKCKALFSHDTLYFVPLEQRKTASHRIIMIMLICDRVRYIY